MMINTLSKIEKYEFHISNKIRTQFNIKEELFSVTGNLIFTNIKLVKELVNNINNEKEDSKKLPFSIVNAAGLMDEIFHFIIRKYEEKINPEVFLKASRVLSSKMGIRPLKISMIDFIEEFPPFAVYKNLQTPEVYLSAKMYSKSNLEITLEELLILYLDNFNPAYKQIKELFDENLLKEKELYKSIIYHIEDFFKYEKKMDNSYDLISFLKQPILQYPYDVDKQLEFVLENWKDLLPTDVVEKLLKSRDYIKEEFGGWVGDGFSPAPTIVPNYKGIGNDEFTLGRSKYKFAKDSSIYLEEEKFTTDTHWMPRVILLAKNIYVWLDQLSNKYQKVIRRLDQIPLEELDNLKKWNFNGLWLIGVWERSSASKKIKNHMGNPDAISSAYSLYDYQIANDLGGESAYEYLNIKCKERGIRLASDMVPNHTGLFSKWIIEKPDYFVQSRETPFPNYTFNGPDLSDRTEIELKIEDGYYNKKDAAVVFRRIDKSNNDVRYIYHGNDGTNMPWNDTAQLDLLKKEVREAVIQQIFEVARKFSIIRFDAAMTLAKKHFQRLWYPITGAGGDIPSRADYSMSAQEFDKMFPVEFWREVVDRINDEMPETLLLAEAFWLMEGYFVRTLGMHRVYNSAFMNMLMREENFKYKQLIKNTLEFEPEILKRYVNFMSNPDEETAIKQFGTGDKYFGVTILMITLPGMPMFAHGQIEGFTEKYGMEYQRAYYNESPNEYLVNKHEKEIFPLCAKRYLFSEIHNFWFFDFYIFENSVNENVFAYSNIYENQKALVLFNNKYESTSGYIKYSTNKLCKLNESQKQLKNLSLSNALLLNNDKKCYYICKEFISGKEYLISPYLIDKEGFKISLKGFEYKVFKDFIEIYDDNGEIEKLYRKLEGNPVDSVIFELEETKLEEVLKSVNEILNEHYIIEFIKSAITVENDESELDYFINSFNKSIRDLFYSLEQKYKLKENNLSLLIQNENCIKTIKSINLKYHDLKESSGRYFDYFYPTFKLSTFGNYYENSLIYLISKVVVNTQKVIKSNKDIEENFFQKLHFNNHIYAILQRTGRGDWEINQEINLINLIVFLENIIDSNLLENYYGLNKKVKIKNTDINIKTNELLNEILVNENIKQFINLNEYKNQKYYRKENFEDLLDWLFSLMIIKIEYDKNINSIEYNFISEKNGYMNLFNAFNEIRKKSDLSSYKYDNLMHNLIEK